MGLLCVEIPVFLVFLVHSDLGSISANLVL